MNAESSIPNSENLAEFKNTSFKNELDSIFGKYHSLFSGQTFRDIKTLRRAMRMAKKSGLHQAGAVAFYTAGAVASILPGVDVRPIVRGNATQLLPFGVQVHNTVRGHQIGNIPLLQSVYDARDGQAIMGTVALEKNSHENSLNGLFMPRRIYHRKGEKSLSTRVQDKIFEKILATGRLLGYKVAASEWKENIPEETAIFATTHFTDFDVPLSAYELHAMGRDISVVSQKTNLEWKNSFGIPQAAGRDRFLPLQNHKRKEKIQGSEWGYTLNHEDFVNFRTVMQAGKDLVIAGHRPTHDGKLPAKMGIGAILMGFITGKPIIPVGMDTAEDKKQTITYSPRISLPALTDEEARNLQDWLDGKKPLDKGIIQKARAAAEQLRDVYKKIEK